MPDPKDIIIVMENGQGESLRDGCMPTIPSTWA